VEKSNHVLQLLTSVLFHATLDVSGIVASKGGWPHEQPELLGLWLIIIVLVPASLPPHDDLHESKFCVLTRGSSSSRLHRRSTPLPSPSLPIPISPPQSSCFVSHPMIPGAPSFAGATFLTNDPAAPPTNATPPGLSNPNLNPQSIQWQLVRQRSGSVEKQKPRSVGTIVQKGQIPPTYHHNPCRLPMDFGESKPLEFQYLQSDVWAAIMSELSGSFDLYLL
jgi:hypothetical protein